MIYNSLLWNKVVLCDEWENLFSNRSFMYTIENNGPSGRKRRFSRDNLSTQKKNISHPAAKQPSKSHASDKQRTLEVFSDLAEVLGRLLGHLFWWAVLAWACLSVPNTDAHREKLKSGLEDVYNEYTINATKEYGLLGTAIGIFSSEAADYFYIDDMVRHLRTKNCLIFSLGYVQDPFRGSERLVSIGIFGHVFLL